jgi:hypothetical protein
MALALDMDECMEAVLTPRDAREPAGMMLASRTTTAAQKSTHQIRAISFISMLQK